MTLTDLRKKILLVLFLFSVLFTLQSCSTDDEPSLELVKTAIGTPQGSASSATIGASGGTVQSADGYLTITVPEGALTTNTTVSIQPISNEAPLGLGTGYRLSPEGTTFSVPVELTFTFTDETLNGVPADFLWIVTQNSDGSWSAALDSEVDAAAKTVTVTTTHFSDWAIGKFVDLSLSPTSRLVKKGESVSLEIVGFTNRAADEDELAPLYNPRALEELVDLTPYYMRDNKFRVKRWTLNTLPAPVNNSNGSLSASNRSATYKAPNALPSTNPVAVTVELEREQDGVIRDNYLLTSNIRVVDDGYYLLLEVDGEQFQYIQYGFNGQVPSNPNDLWIANASINDNGLQLGGGHMMGTTGTHLFTMEIADPHITGFMLKCIHDTGDDDVSYSPAGDGNAYQLSYSVRQWQNDACNIEYRCSQFAVRLLDFKDDVITGEFTGKLYLDTDEMEDNCESSEPKNVSGSFQLFAVPG